MILHLGIFGGIDFLVDIGLMYAFLAFALLFMFPFLGWRLSSSFPSCGFAYYLINIIVALIGIMGYKKVPE